MLAKLNVAAVSGINGTYLGYDTPGRVVRSRQVTVGTAYDFPAYSFDLSGNMVSETYPSGRVVANSFDTANRLSIVSGQKSGEASRTYANNFGYTAHGAVQNMRLGNNRWEHTLFNSRLQPTEIGLGAGPNSVSLLGVSYSYGTTDNNGNVKSQTINVPTIGSVTGFTATQSYEYDPLNRLKTATEMSGATQTWKQTYIFDRWGNRNFSTGTTIPDLTNTTQWPTNIYNPQVDTATNRLTGGQGYEYDAAGNVTQDATGKRFAYDAENKQTSFGTGGSSPNGGSYYYDGDGQRVKKALIGSQAETIFIYNVAAQLVAEYNLNSEPEQNGTSYLTSDTLGTPRVITKADATVKSRHDYLPFGEEIFANTGNRTTGQKYGEALTPADTVRQKFTSKERDSETGLDYFGARYYASTQGRFTTTDPLLSTGRPIAPQTWNRFTYVLNNPLVMTDPTGLYECNGTTAQCASFQAGLDAAAAKLDDIKKFYGDKSIEYTDAVRAVNSYGGAGVDNGVSVSFGTLGKGTLGETTGSLDKDGNKSINVTIDLTQNKNGSDLLTTIAHEGSHVQDHSEYQDALIAAGKADSGDGSKVMAVVNGVPTHGISETRAFGVSSVFAQFSLGGGSGESAITSAGGITTFKLDLPPVKSTTVGGQAIWKSSWQTLDVQEIRANRTAAIADGLRKDSRYAPKLNTPIE